MTVARSKRSLSRFDAVVHAGCSDGQRDWTHFVLPRGDRSLAIKRRRIAKQISLGPAGSPAMGQLSVKARFGRTGAVSGSLSGTWRYSDGTTCSSGSIAFRGRPGRYAPPRDPREPRAQHPLPGPPTAGPPTPGGPGGSPGQSGPTQPLGAYQHIVWIVMENHGYNQVVGSSSAPFLNSLVSQYGSATNMFAEDHPSLPNYIAMTSGSRNGVSDDADPSSHRLNVENIFHQLPSGASRSLEESMPSNCYGSDFGGTYAPRHNPMAYYTNLGTDCQNYDVPLGSTPDVSAKFTFITPNLCNDMHDCSVSTGDNWLSTFIPTITSTADYQAGKTAIFVTWDEDDSTEGNHIPTIIVDPKGAHDTSACQGTRYTHYSMLKFVEQNFGLAQIANAASASSMAGCFGLR